MIYRLLMLSDENDYFKRELQIDSEATFLELNDFILDAVGYAHDELTTFHICDEAWQKEQEVTMMDMGMSSEYDSYLMESTPLEELLDHKGQHLFFVSRSVAPASGEVWDEDGLEEDSIDEGEIDLEGFDIADAESLY